MQISVFGSGYVGLVTGTCFAEMGNEVICADIDPEKIAILEKGRSPIYESGLEDLIKSNLKQGRLSFTTDLKRAIQSSELLFIAVGTPSDTNGQADLKSVLDVASTIGEHLNGYKAIVNKSTVPVGTAQKVKAAVLEKLRHRKVDFEFDVISNPEFLREGTAVEDCLYPSRVVVGSDTQRATSLMTKLYEPFLTNGGRFIAMDLHSSELTKYAANAMLATKISLMNELSRLCEKVGADIEKIRDGIGTDPRIGYHFIYSGLGYGGSCLPKDIKALIHTADTSDEDLLILKAVQATNQLQRKRFYSKIENYFSGNLAGKKIAVWGLSFKPGTDDIREAPSIYLVDQLRKAKAHIIAFDPAATSSAQKTFYGDTQVQFVETPYDALKDIDALCIATEWKQFREPNFEKMKSLMKNPVIFDGRNLYDQEEMKKLGFQYFSIGRS